jgi:NAD(P)-dependent dehydrogenase (short-subunit alcohol dehydrogenase family)
MLNPQGAALLVHRHRLGLDDISPTALAQRVAVVTGGGRGVGRMLAQSLAGTGAGAAVGVVARSSDELAQTVSLIESAGGVARSQTADVADARALAAAFARLGADLGPVDLLVNNAGVLGPIGPLWETDADDWWRTMEINLGGMLAQIDVVREHDLYVLRPERLEDERTA